MPGLYIAPACRPCLLCKQVPGLRMLEFPAVSACRFCHGFRFWVDTGFSACLLIPLPFWVYLPAYLRCFLPAIPGSATRRPAVRYLQPRFVPPLPAVSATVPFSAWNTVAWVCTYQNRYTVLPCRSGSPLRVPLGCLLFCLPAWNRFWVPDSAVPAWVYRLPAILPAVRSFHTISDAACLP